MTEPRISRLQLQQIILQHEQPVEGYTLEQARKALLDVDFTLEQADAALAPYVAVGKPLQFDGTLHNCMDAYDRKVALAASKQEYESVVHADINQWERKARWSIPLTGAAAAGTAYAVNGLLGACIAGSAATLSAWGAVNYLKSSRKEAVALEHAWPHEEQYEQIKQVFSRYDAEARLGFCLTKRHDIYGLAYVSGNQFTTDSVCKSTLKNPQHLYYLDRVVNLIEDESTTDWHTVPINTPVCTQVLRDAKVHTLFGFTCTQEQDYVELRNPLDMLRPNHNVSKQETPHSTLKQLIPMVVY